jgi:hypothetical protein
LLNTGVVRCGADHFAVAALFWDHMINMFKLTLFSPATGVWTTRVAPLEEPSESPGEPEVLNFQPTKVIPLKGSIWGSEIRNHNGVGALSLSPSVHFALRFIPERSKIRVPVF